MTLSAMVVPSVDIRVASQPGTRPPWSGRSAVPGRYILCHCLKVTTGDALSTFMEAASVPLDGSGHASGTLDRAQEILAAHPEVATADIYAAAVLGDESSIRRFVEMDRASAAAKGGQKEWGWLR